MNDLRIAKGYSTRIDARDQLFVSHIKPEKNPSLGTHAYYYSIAYEALYKKDTTERDVELSLQSCLKSLERTPNNPYSLNLLAEIYTKKNDIANAKAENEKAIKYAKDTGDRELIRQIEGRLFP